jgi:2,5-diketo-D-gluconate reductase B
MLDVNVQGISVPALGLGTWQMAGPACCKAVERALALGYRHIDTAQAYGNEREVGEAIRATDVPREELFITTKLAVDEMTRERVHRSTHESIKRLALDYVDLLLIHWPHRAVPLRETLDAMMALVDEGLVSRIGVSNFPADWLEEALTMAPIACLQVECHPFLAQRALLEQAQRHDLLFTAYCPLARGRVVRDRVLVDVGHKHGKTASQVALRWLVQRSNVSAIPKAQGEAHLREDIDIFDFALDDNDLARIATLDRGERIIDLGFAPDWSPVP